MNKKIMIKYFEENKSPRNDSRSLKEKFIGQVNIYVTNGTKRLQT